MHIMRKIYLKQLGTLFDESNKWTKQITFFKINNKKSTKKNTLFFKIEHHYIGFNHAGFEKARIIKRNCVSTTSRFKRLISCHRCVKIWP